ncbi:DUF3667 domain-containing protein [Opitutus sp. ER46]|uniref:DUF3667 domain-containing protein n=1 Tax=Opitutus sp. ER46 TaxID=2161864 RepID=UPI000D2F74D0|nr:DUF3667 domain-containing protein [Opitutus sp. ER46]PTX98546.1 hypothetical protein DB354_04595 [Opitutus sp. ER46]
MSATPDLPDGPIVPEPSFSGSDELLVGAALAASGGSDGHGHHGPQHTHCENCGTKLEGPYCHRCGQPDFEFHRSFRHVFMEALETWFHFEGKFFRNIVTLLFRPGQLTAEFNRGKRAAQMPPFRLYLFVSVVFFFVMFLGRPSHAPVVLDAKSHEDPTSVSGTVGTVTDALATAASTTKSVRENGRKRAETGSLKPEVGSQRPEDGGLRAEVGGQKPEVGGLKTEVGSLKARDAKKGEKKEKHINISGSEDSAALRWLEELGEKAERPGAAAQITEAFLHNIPKLLLVCLPFFALITRVLFWRSGQVYLQHLVLALHFHAFIYLWILFRNGWAEIAKLMSPSLGSLLWALGTLWLCIYPFMMFRRLFGNSWFRTIMKGSVLAFAHGTLLVIGFTVSVLLVLATM